MKVFLLRVGISKELYPRPAYIFGVGHYIPMEVREDEFSRKLIYFYKYGNEPEFFLEKFVDLFKLRFLEDTVKFDYITLYPTHEKDKINPHMENLVRNLSKGTGLPYKQILRRNRNIEPTHKLKTLNERKDNVMNSIDILEDVTGKNIIVLDNTTTTGISLIDVTNLLLEHGARNIACVCLGLGYKGKDSDWTDLNKTLKYSRVIKVCKGPYVPNEIHEKWKKTHT